MDAGRSFRMKKGRDEEPDIEHLMTMTLLGEGGFGEVWHLPDIDPPMVMKKPKRTDNYENCLRELRTLKELSHENVVRYYDQPENYPGIDNNEWLIFMEYCEHGSLKDVLQNTAITYSMATIAKWSTEMFSGLEYIKSMQKIHRDIKPANLFIYGDEYTLKLGDFGIARSLGTMTCSREGTHGYIAPEVRRGEKLSGEDAYKSDIYGAGWVVLDMANRSKPGNQNIEEILQDEFPQLATIKSLVKGCTQLNVNDRFCVQQALALCKEMLKGFDEFHAKPDQNPRRKRLERPDGMPGQWVEIPDGITITSTTDDDRSEVKQSNPKSDPREKLLMDFKEQFEVTTTFEGAYNPYDLRACKWNEITWPQDDDCGHGICKKTRSQLCEEIHVKLSNLSIEDQYECAEKMDKLWKMKTSISFDNPNGKIREYGKFKNMPDYMNLEETIVDVLESFYFLVRRDKLQQEASQDFGITMLHETDIGTLAPWDIIQLLNEAIHDIEELRKLFTTRAVYRNVIIERSRYFWFYIYRLDLFLRKDGTEIRKRNTMDSILLRYHRTDKKEPLNNEHIRRALIDARTYYKRKVGDLFGPAERRCPNGFDMLRSDPFLHDFHSACLVLLKELPSLPDQPFPGYAFDAFPPGHECSTTECAVAGGFPATADPEVQINYHQCATEDQKAYLEAYVLMKVALNYISRWKKRDPWFYKMTDKLLTTISSKHTPWKFYLPWIKLKNGTDVLMILRELEVAFLTKNMEFDYLNLREAVLQRLVPVKLTDIQPILISMRNHCQDPYASSKNTEDPYPRPIQQTIKKFWKGIKTATPFVTFPKPGNQITYGPDSDRAPIKLLDRGRFRELWILPYTDPPLVMKKPLRTDDYASYLMQLRTLKDLAHENVVRYYDRPVDPQIDSAEWLIFMEYCEHGSLRDVLQNQEIAYSMATVAKWSTEMFSGLKHIQSKKIIHHDIKPDNLFVHGHGYILKLGNFESTFSELSTSYNWRGGTMGYLAPEELACITMGGEDAYKCDIYSAGWVVLDMVNRSESGCKDIDFILRDDLPHLETIKKLVIGCTNTQVHSRFDVDKALELCSTIAKEFDQWSATPDRKNHRQRLEPPIGLYEDGNDDFSRSETMSPLGILGSIGGPISSDGSASEGEEPNPHNAPRTI